MGGRKKALEKSLTERTGVGKGVYSVEAETFCPMFAVESGAK